MRRLMKVFVFVGYASWHALAVGQPTSASGGGEQDGRVTTSASAALAVAQPTSANRGTEKDGGVTPPASAAVAPADGGVTPANAAVAVPDGGTSPTPEPSLSE